MGARKREDYPATRQVFGIMPPFSGAGVIGAGVIGTATGPPAHSGGPTSPSWR